MEKLNLVCVIISVLLVTNNHGKRLSWKLFETGSSTSSISNIKAYANQRLTALRNLRNQLHNSARNDQFLPPEEFSNTTQFNVKSGIRKNMQRKGSAEIKPMRREVGSVSLFRNLDKLLTLASPIKNMITSKQGIESLASMVMPKRDVIQKLLEIKGHLEPSLKRYLTDTYNGFLSSLIPYSENIGVPPFVLNSMKIPQGLDPRWQLIQSIIKSKDGLENFIHSVVSGDAFEKFPEVMESRSGDETDLISDQEPDATGQAFRKHQQMHLSSFKKRLMKPGVARYRLMPTSGGVLRPSMDYENILDQNGQFSQVAYDMRAPDDIESSLPPGVSEMDMMLMSASGHGGRGHGHGHGHGQGHATYGGFLDPFTILGGLAFLTYLGLMLQNSLNRNNTMGRSLPWEVMPNFRTVQSINLPIGNLKGTQLKRRQRSVNMFDKSEDPKLFNRVIDYTVDAITGVWNELEEFNIYHSLDPICMKSRICKIVFKMNYNDLLHVFVSRLINSTNAVEHKFLVELLNDKDLKSCLPYWKIRCKTHH